MFLGLDIGTSGVRCVIVDSNSVDRDSADSNGTVIASGTCSFSHGEINSKLPDSQVKIPENWALQHPVDWIESVSKAIEQCLAENKNAEIEGIGVAFSSCTVIPCRRNGLPICLEEEFREHPHAWPKLWKHHGASNEAETISKVVQDERWLKEEYGDKVELESLFPKLLEVYEQDREVFDATDYFIEAGDWLVWILSGANDEPVRSCAQAGYKGYWTTHSEQSERTYLPASCCDQISNGFSKVLTKLKGEVKSPGIAAGVLSCFTSHTIPNWSENSKFNIPDLNGIKLLEHHNPKLSVSTIDSHSGCIGANAGGEGVLCLVLGTSGCYILNHSVKASIPGLAGRVKDGLVNGLYGYKARQPALGDAFAWLSSTTNVSLEKLTKSSSELFATWCKECDNDTITSRCFALNRFNDATAESNNATGSNVMSSTGVLFGLTLDTSPAEIYLALAESFAFSIVRLVRSLGNENVQTTHIVSTGGLAQPESILLEIVATMLDTPVSISNSSHGGALGAAVYGACAATEQPLIDVCNSLCEAPSGTIVPLKSSKVKQALEQRFVVHGSF